MTKLTPKQFASEYNIMGWYETDGVHTICEGQIVEILEKYELQSIF